MRWIFPASATLLSFSVAALSQVAPRPKITGVSHIAVYASDPAATEHFYTVTLGAVKLPDPENPQGVKYALSNTQYVEVLPLPAGAGVNRLDHVAFATWSAEAMRKYLHAKGWQVPDHVTRGADSSVWFEVRDPEGNKVQFVQTSPMQHVNAPDAIGHHIIHVGFLVHSREAEDGFYRNLLGFRPYWYGGMQDNKVDWVSQQTPDGHDWLEYMMTSDTGSGIPAGMSQHQLGVLDHFSVGEQSVDTAFATLKRGDRLHGVQNDGATKIGRDGKAQFNMYDPDQIRVELMNLHATEKPCCSAFTADDPAE